MEEKNEDNNILIFFAHPGTQGHNVLILEETISFLKEHNKKYELIDLYKIQYDPVLKKEELYTSGNRELSKQTKEFQEKIKNSNKLIFIFPIWWNGPPAILKGFFDRVFTGKFAFQFKKVGKFNVPTGLLKNKKAVVLFSTGGPKWVSKILFRSGAKKNICRDILYYCGIKSKGYQLDNATIMDKKTTIRTKKLVSKGIHWLMK